MEKISLRVWATIWQARALNTKNKRILVGAAASNLELLSHMTDTNNVAPTLQKRCINVSLQSLILVKVTKIRLYSQFSDWFETKQNSVLCQINWKRIITIRIWFDITRFRKNVSMCNVWHFINWRNSILKIWHV